MPAPRPPFPDNPDGGQPLLFHIHDFVGVNQNAPRDGIKSNESTWLENLMPIQPGNLRAMWAEGSNVYTVPAGGTPPTIVNVYFYNIGNTPFAIVFLSDGTAQQFNTNTGAVVQVSAAAGKFFIGGFVPVAAQWNASGIVIVTEASNPSGYFSWDGSILTGPGSLAPSWLTNGAVTTMPSGLHGNGIEIFNNRAWITTPFNLGSTPSTITVSAAANGADFLTADGSVVTPQQDSSLRYVFNAIKQSNGLLYVLGDSNCIVISNVQTSGSPPITTYSNQNLDPQVGTAWQNSAQLFGNALIYANTQGVYVLSGGVVQKVSQQLDQLFANADFSVIPTASVAIIFGVKCYLLLLKVVDFAGVGRNVLCVWDTKRWFFASTLNTLTKAVYFQEFNSNLIAWGTDGSHIYRLFQLPSRTLTKTIQSKLYSGGQDDDLWWIWKKAYRFAFKAKDLSGTGITMAGTIDSEMATVSDSITAMAAFFEFTNSSAAVIHFQNASSQTILWGISTVGIGGKDVSQYGKVLGWTQTVTGADFSLVAIGLEYSYDAPFLG